MWHASIAKLGSSAPVPTDRWGDGVRHSANRLLTEALSGVGKEPTVTTMRKIAVHMRRSLSDEEMGMLTCEWLAIPARDEFSEDGEVEMSL